VSIFGGYPYPTVGRHVAAEAAILTRATEARIITDHAARWVADYDAAEVALVPRDDALWLVMLGQARALLEEVARG